jgi:predicted acylesterase/phospholipase RssA
MKIKALVISGGGYFGFSEYGALKYLITNSIIDLNEIKEFYTCSIGSIIAIILSLKLEWDLLDDYLIKRPWNKILKINLESILEIYRKKGLIEKKFFLDILLPLFEYLNIPITITLKEFEEKVNYKFNFSTTSYDKLEYIKINSEEYPDIELLDAINMTCCIPVIFVPVYYKNNLFMDGGILNGYPVDDALDKYKKNEIFGIRLQMKFEKEKENINLSELNIFEYLLHIILMMRNKISKVHENELENYIFIYTEHITIKEFKEVLNSEEKRIELIELGINRAKEIYNKENKEEDVENHMSNSLI